MSIPIPSPVPTVELRPLVMADLVTLSDICTTYKTETILRLETQSDGLLPTWTLREQAMPFDKGDLYDLRDPDLLDGIENRLKRPDECYQRVADFEGRLVGFVDVEYQAWNNTAQVWNLYVDLDYRKQGIGRRLWHRAREFAKEEGTRAILIETQNTNIGACQFYQRMGCQLVGFNHIFYANDPTPPEEFALFWGYMF